MSVRKAYIERLNQAREARGFSVDSLSRRCGYPADLVAPLFEGRPVMFSEEMNRELCQALDLDAREMWELAQPTATRQTPRTAE
jgi:transcriptional regulator with XRE-family HTH domain